MRRCLYYALAGLLITVVLFLWGPRAQQVRRMAKARVHVDCLEADLRGDERFEYVRFSVGTGESGALIVDGVVGNQSDLDALHSIVTDAEVSVSVVYFAQVMDLDEYRVFLQERETKWAR